MNKGVKLTAYLFIAFLALATCWGERKKPAVSEPKMYKRTFINGTGKDISSIVLIPDKSNGICLMFPVELSDQERLVLPLPCDLKNGNTAIAVTFKGVMKAFTTKTDICILDNPNGSSSLIKMKGKRSTVPFFSRKTAIALAVVAIGSACACFIYTLRKGGLFWLLCPIMLLAGGFLIGWTAPSTAILVILAGSAIGTVFLILYLLNLLDLHSRVPAIINGNMDDFKFHPKKCQMKISHDEVVFEYI